MKSEQNETSVALRARAPCFWSSGARRLGLVRHATEHPGTAAGTTAPARRGQDSVASRLENIYYKTGTPPTSVKQARCPAGSRGGRRGCWSSRRRRGLFSAAAAAELMHPARCSAARPRACARCALASHRKTKAARGDVSAARSPPPPSSPPRRPCAPPRWCCFCGLVLRGYARLA